MELRFRIEADGSLTVSSEKEVFLKNAYPHGKQCCLLRFPI